MTCRPHGIASALVIAILLASSLGCGGGSSSATAPAMPVELPLDGREEPDNSRPPDDTRRALSLPDNHGLALGRLTIQPGASEAHGNVVASCPAGGGACVIDLADDGSATYDQTGGVPTVTEARAMWELPADHRLAAGRFALEPGSSDTRGNVVVSCPAGGGACVVQVLTDGTATYSRTGGTPSVMPAYAMLSLPENHGLAVGRFTIQPGASGTRGNVAVSCPAGGNACVVEVAADDSATYSQTGGMPGIMAAHETWAVPENHGLAAGRFTIQPGASDIHGNVAVSCPAGGRPCVVNAAADGSATYSRIGGTPSIILSMPDELPGIPLQRAVHAAQAPIVDPIVEPDGNLHVGADVAPPGAALTSMETHAGVAISAGRVQDGEAGQRILEFLTTHVGGGASAAGGTYTFERGITGLSTFAQPPVVRLAEGTSEEYADYAVRAVQLINSALPHDKRIVFSNDPAPPLATTEDLPDGEIFIDFAPTRDEWKDVGADHPSYASAAADPDDILEFNRETQLWESRGARAGHVWFSVEHLLNQAWVLNPDTEQFELMLLDAPVVETDTVLRANTEEDILSTMVHELLHVLGFYGHNDQARFPDSIMRGLSLLYIDHLPGIDGESLLAAYTRFEPGTSPDGLSTENLGPWDDTSFHLRGDAAFQGGSAAFGVASRNGLAQPWAFGPRPWTNLADNPVLSGTALWSGRLLGLTPAVEPVGGSADLAVQLDSLDGQLDFGDLEHWAADADPGPIGSGTTWGNGDLQYLVNVRGNTFVQTGGDEGVVTGAFFGPVHGAMGGVLERTDLSAAFGGTQR